MQHEPSLSDHLYLTLDDTDVREQARLAPDDLVRSAPRLALDEVQREPDLLLAVKRVVDSDRPRKNGRFVLTGSANLLLMQRVSESLAGRATYVHLWPLTRRERLGRGVPGIWSALLSTPVDKWAALLSGEEDAPADWRTSWAKSWNAARTGFPGLRSQGGLRRSFSRRACPGLRCRDARCAMVVLAVVTVWPCRVPECARGSWR